jgi:hypothetical protein
VETGTFQGGGARALAAMFPAVVTVELSDRYFELARAELAAVPNVVTEHGASPDVLRRLEAAPTLYWLDAHWSGLDTAGEDTYGARRRGDSGSSCAYAAGRRRW